jgi:hypothetical protein
MTLAYGEMPFGCRDCKIYALSGTTYSTGIDVPRIRHVTFTLAGDDVTVAVQTFAKKLTGSIESGGINLATLGVLESGTVGSETGSTPSRKTTYQVQGTDIETYFGLIAQAIANDGGDIFLKVYKVKCTSGPQVNLENGAFSLTTGDLEAVFDAQSPSHLYDIIAHETAGTINTAWTNAANS